VILELYERYRHRGGGGNNSQDCGKLKTVALGRNVYLVARTKVKAVE
jgi:hypothetical protein